MYKYITWTDGEYFEGHNLMNKRSCLNVTDSLSRTKHEVFATIQDYDADGNCIGCPLYFDIDSPSLYDAWEQARLLYDAIEEEFNVQSFVWFSGGKGFHILSPLYVRHPRCHEIVSIIRQELFKHIDIDDKVYRTRSMLRVENTWNIKGDKYKIPCDNWNQLTLDKIMLMADGQVTSDWRSKWNTTDLDIDEAVEKLPEFKPIVVDGSVEFSDMMPCLKNLWLRDTPPDGDRHELAFLFVRHCYRSGLSKEQTASAFYEHPFWKNVRENDYMKIIRSVFTSGNAAMGCTNNKLLRDNCVIACKYNSEFDLTKYIRR
jgi:hypothetical protein